MSNSKNKAYLLQVSIAFLILGATLFSRFESISFHYDESHWISTSYYYEVLVEQNSDSFFWTPIYWTLTQPPITRYLIGFSRKAAGFEIEDLNNRWDFDLDYETNVFQGNLPEENLLKWSRFPMVILCILGGLIIFWLLLKVVNSTAAWFFLVCFAFNPYFQTRLCRAMGEAPLFFFTSLSFFFGFFILKKWGSYSENQKGLNEYYLLLVLAGFAIGLAGASKINGMASLCSFIGLIIFLMIFFPANINKEQRIKIGIRSIFILFICSLFTFIIVNPFLYEATLTRMGQMLQFRLSEMEIQIGRYPQSVVTGIGGYGKIFWNRLFVDFIGMKSTYLGILGFELFILGSLEIFQLFSEIFHRRSFQKCQWFVILLPFPLALAGYFSPLDWDRYYLFTILFITLIMSVGFGYLIKVLINSFLFIKNRKKTVGIKRA
jgi:hypothetical protein